MTTEDQNTEDLPELELSQDVNDYDQGSNSESAESKLGDKNLSKRVAQLEAELQSMKSNKLQLSRVDYIVERQRKMQAGDRDAINEYMVEQTAINQQLIDSKTRSRAEYDLRQEDKAITTTQQRLDNLPSLDREKLDNDIAKLERRKQREIENLEVYFAAQGKEWTNYLNDLHRPEESPAHDLITRSDNGRAWCYVLHKYQPLLEAIDGRKYSSSFTISAVERHIRAYEPEEHKNYILELIEQKYKQEIEAVMDKAAEDPDIKLKREIREIEQTKTRTGGDWNMATKINREGYPLEAGEIEQIKTRPGEDTTIHPKIKRADEWTKEDEEKRLIREGLRRED